MREKQLCLIVTFYTTAGAIAMERLCAEAHLEGRLIPVPREVTSDCGMSWRCAVSLREEIESLIAQHTLDAAGIYEMMV